MAQFPEISDYFSSLWDSIYTVIEFVYIFFVGLTSIFIITENKNPSKTLAWVLVVVFVPVFGIILYIFFGQTYRKRKIFSRKGLQDFVQLNNLKYEQLQKLSNPEILKNKAVWKKLHIIKLLLNNNKATLTTRNNIQILNNGKEKIDELIKCIQQAQEHIHLEYYILQDDHTGLRIINCLAEASKRGVKTRLIYDHVGSWHIKEKTLQLLKKSGIEAKQFMRVTFPFLTSKINYRNHRKIVVIDGKTGFVGGMNIANRYVYGTKKLGSWRDAHLKIEGNAVHSLQSVFLTDWFFLTKSIPAGNFFPSNTINKECLVQIASSGPDSDWASIMQTYFYAISTARESIYITTPYFLPNTAILTALKTVALSGVDVKIIVPKISDSTIVHYASLSYVKELLSAGIKVYQYNKGFIHSKVIIVDNILSSVGTANMDYRSFSINFEVNAIIYNNEVAQNLLNTFQIDIKNSIQLEAATWNNRTKLYKLKCSLARMFSPLL